MKAKTLPRQVRFRGVVYTLANRPSRLFKSAGHFFAPVPASGHLRTAAKTGDRKTNLIQYVDMGSNSMQPVGSMRLIPQLEPGIYNVASTMSGLSFEQQEINTDSLLRFEDPIHKEILGELDDFWRQKPRYEKKGFLHNRAILMFGPPGSGKSCLIKLAIEDLISKKDIVFTGTAIHNLTEGLRLFREVEPNRRCLAVLEDVDELGEHALLQLLDGGNTADHVMYLATTNYVDRLPPRVLRPGRFDRKIEIPFPPAAGRLAYLKSKLADEHLSKHDMKRLVKETYGFSFGHLRELITGAFIRKQPLKQVLARLRGSGLEMAKQSQ
jgi:hypothetical protein